jgi:hypothetical protein
MQSNLTSYNRAVDKIAKQLKLNPIKVDKVYRAYCKLIIDKISALPLKEDLTEEEFNQLQVNVNLPSLGKLYTSWQTYKNLKQKLIYVQKAKENKAAKHRPLGNNDSL